MRIWKRNRMLKRIVLGFALVALVIPAGRAKAMPDAGRSYENKSVPVITFREYDPSANAGGGTPVGVPHAGLNDYLQSRDGVELVRLQPRSTLRNTDMIEQVRVSPRGISTPHVVASPDFDWSDAGVGAGILAGLVILGGAAYFGTRHLGRPETA
jgi:hypothetical protein